MAGRRTSLASLAGAKVDDVPGRSDPLLLSLPLDKLVPTRFNPRRRFGTEEELREFGAKLAKEQLQPAVVVTRTAYLKLWPGEAEHVENASYVIANGERRWRASRLVGRPVLEVVHKEDVAASRAAFLDAVQSENNDRQDLDPIERALGIDIMVTELGGADRVAVYYGKTKGWVSQQRKLLRLTPKLQDLVSAGEMPVRVARDIAGLPAEVQGTAWEEEVAKRKAAKEAADRWKTTGAPGQAPPEAPGPAPRFTAVNRHGDTAASPQAAQTAVAEPEPALPVLQQPPAGMVVPEPRDAVPAAVEVQPGGRKPGHFPYDDGALASQLLIDRMPEAEFDTMLEALTAHRAQRHAGAG
ncbi:MAG: ParB N-terminal domain-containing protein [Streptomyces sp.]|nr:ParB N-terminal domain-containing protein [Streptomyces sp.]NUS15461.1 ParB N-terminal domain-containing protein [Streptomyces sp.]NUS24081.1 ParB N-terminal domain-containing protein [Streptomyces sp.]